MDQLLVEHIVALHVGDDDAQHVVDVAGHPVEFIAKTSLKIVPGPSRDDAVTQALRARYGNDLPEIGEAWNGVLANLLAHRRRLE
ncbi:hypothetical protein ABIE89_007278 [Bradyrhizobium niftali]